jgi:predicted transposase YbfD/YdcC
MDHTSRGVLAQTQVDTKSNEITGFRPLLEGLDLAGQVLTADAMHTNASTPTGWSPASTPPTC